MENGMSTRRLRLIEALEMGDKPPQIDTAVILSLENAAAKQQQLQEQLEQANSAQATTTDKRRITIEMKLKVLENWEVTKLKAVERLAVEVEVLQEIEEAIERREQELTDSGISIDEASLDSAEYVTSRRANAAKRYKVDDNKKAAGARPQAAALPRASPAERKAAMPKRIADMLQSNGDEIAIGPNGTKIAKMALTAINWSLSGAAVTRKILMEVFDRSTLASHTLSGKPSPAFMDCDKPLKHQLDPAKVADIMHIVTENLHMTPKEVRATITTKCADENKMMRMREKKRQSQTAGNKKLKD